MMTVIIVSEWTGAKLLKSKANLDIATGEITEVESMDEIPGVKSLLELESEYLLLDGREYDIEHDEDSQRCFVQADALKELQAFIQG